MATKNKLSKGRNAEKLCKDIWKKEGWITEIKNWNRWQGKDFYGLFDFIAIKGGSVEFVQVKTNLSDYNTARRDIRRWKQENNLEIKTGVWLYNGNSIWIVDNFVDNLPKNHSFLINLGKRKIDKNEFKNKIFVDNTNLVLERGRISDVESVDVVAYIVPMET